MHNSDNSNKVFRLDFWRGVAAQATYLMAVGAGFTLALAAGFTLLEG